MKKVMLSMVAVAIAFSTTKAQETKTAPATTTTPATTTAAPAATKPAPRQSTPEERTERYMKSYDNEYGLTDDQKTKIKAIVLKREQSRDELKKKYADDKDTYNKENRTVSIDAEKAIKALVTPEQLEKQKAYREGQKAKSKENMEKRKAAEGQKDKATPADAPKTKEVTPQEPKPTMKEAKK